MLNFLFGGLTVAVVFTFFPSLGGKISAGLVSAYAWVKTRVRPRGDV